MRLTLILIAGMLLWPGPYPGNQGDTCNAKYVLGNIGGTWKVNNAFGQGFGGYFWNKPRVTIRVQGGAMYVDEGGPFTFSNYRTTEDAEGRTWCTFEVEQDDVDENEPGRLGEADDGGWILEFGTYHQRNNRVELIRR